MARCVNIIVMRSQTPQIEITVNDPDCDNDYDQRY